MWSVVIQGGIQSQGDRALSLPRQGPVMGALNETCQWGKGGGQEDSVTFEVHLAILRCHSPQMNWTSLSVLFADRQGLYGKKQY